MANLKSIEKLKLEKYFEMENGYVCDFSNKTFADFVLENVGINIYEDKYAFENSGSKASRLRSFWAIESNYIVGKLLDEIIEYWKFKKSTPIYGYELFNRTLYMECKKIASKLQSDTSVTDIDAITPNTHDKDFSLLAKSIRESIEKDEPEQALDRLHTFLMKYVRELCDKHSIEYKKDTPLHSLFGGYVKFLSINNFIESEMTERILKSSISIFESFNSVRNEQSLAHDNPILNHNESTLIFNNVSNILRFIEPIESIIPKKEEKPKEIIDWEDIEFSSEEIDAAGDQYIQNMIDIRRGK